MISVIIPTYNAERTIERALESVSRQSYRDLEVLVVDDGSTDGTASIVDFHARSDPRIRLIRRNHAGPASARNTGLDHATGQWVAFLDADDTFERRTFEKTLHRIGEKSIDLAIFSIQMVRDYIYAWPPDVVRLDNKYFSGDEGRPTAFIDQYFRSKRMLVYSQCNKLYRREIIEAHKIRFPARLSFGEDRLFNYEYLKHTGSIVTMREKLLNYHHGRPGTMSQRFEENFTETLSILAEAKLDLFRHFGYSEDRLDEIRQHDAKQVLNEIVQHLIREDRIGGISLSAQGIRTLLTSSSGPSYFSIEAATSRRTLAFRLALNTRMVPLIAVLVRFLRFNEDRRRLQTRRGEFDWEKTYERHQTLGVGRLKRSRHYYLADYEYFLDQINEEQHRNLLRDKAILLSRLSDSSSIDFLRRDWLDLRRSTYSEFAALADCSEQLIAKLFNGAVSKGTQVIDLRTEQATTQVLHQRLISRKQYVVEECLPQHPALATIYESALTTLRIHTLNLGGKVEVVLPLEVKFGSLGGLTNNENSIHALFDAASGRITTHGITRESRKEPLSKVLTHHPDSGVAFQNQTVPFAIEAVELAKQAALKVPELPFIGWDIACTPDGPAVIEGNAASLVHATLQDMMRVFFGQRGMRKDFEEILKKFKRYQREQRKRVRRELRGRPPSG